MSQELRKILDLHPSETEGKIVEIPSQAEEDFDFARRNLYELIQKSHEALEDMVDLSKKSQDRRSYETLNNIIVTTAKISQDLLNLQKQKQEITGAPAPTTVNNNLFVGTTADLNKIIEDRRKENE